jgi:hypothetical protein
MADFIPGPWELAWEDGKHGVIADAAGGKFVCIVGNADDGLNDVRKANAQLISAAPELMEACKLAMRVVDSSHYPEVYDFLHDACAKARGGID